MTPQETRLRDVATPSEAEAYLRAFVALIERPPRDELRVDADVGDKVAAYLTALLSEVDRLRGEANQHRVRVERLAATLRFYASKNAWRSATVYMCGHSAPSQAVLDGGRRALRALSQEGEG